MNRRCGFARWQLKPLKHVVSLVTINLITASSTQNRVLRHLTKPLRKRVLDEGRTSHRNQMMVEINLRKQKRLRTLLVARYQQ